MSDPRKKVKNPLIIAREMTQRQSLLANPMVRAMPQSVIVNPLVQPQNVIANPLVRAVAQKRALQEKAAPYRGENLMLNVKRPENPIPFGKTGMLPVDMIPSGTYEIAPNINYYTDRRGVLERRSTRDVPPSYKKGGKVKKTGLALVHKGEMVIPASRVASVVKAVKKAGMKPLKK